MNPTAMIMGRIQIVEILSPKTKAVIKDVVPVPKPLIVEIRTPSKPDMRLVTLFSKPQQTEATRTTIAPGENLNEVKSSKERTIDAKKTRMIPNMRRGDTFSLKNIAAIMTVMKISKFPSKDAVDGSLSDNPHMVNIEASESRRTINMIHGMSFFTGFFSKRAFSLLRNKSIKSIPNPHP